MTETNNMPLDGFSEANLKNDTVKDPMVIGHVGAGKTSITKDMMESGQVVVIDDPHEEILTRAFTGDWNPLDGAESTLKERLATGNYVAAIDTKDWHYSVFLKDKRTYVPPKKVKVSGYEYAPTTFLTLDEVMEQIKMFRDRKFVSNLSPGYEKMFINSRLQTLVYHKREKGFLLCDAAGWSYPNAVIADTVLYDDDVNSIIHAGKLNAQELSKIPVYDPETGGIRNDEALKQLDNFDVADDDNEKSRPAE